MSGISIIECSFYGVGSASSLIPNIYVQLGASVMLLVTNKEVSNELKYCYHYYY